jgi:hypothetical protein
VPFWGYIVRWWTPLHVQLCFCQWFLGDVDLSVPFGAQESVLDTQSVSFVDGKVVMKPYMDSFPFPFYIVLRDLAALPQTLADLLRQWFQLSAGE